MSKRLLSKYYVLCVEFSVKAIEYICINYLIIVFFSKMHSCACLNINIIASKVFYVSWLITYEITCPFGKKIHH